MEKETGTEKKRERATVPSASQVCRRPSPKILSSVINIFLQKKKEKKKENRLKCLSKKTT